METLGPYELLDVVGQGGMGRVYRARDTRYDRVVALKVILEHEQQEEDFVKYFRREAELVGRMNSPHIVPIHGYGDVDETAYLDMRYVDGMSLSQIVRQFGPASFRTAVDIIEQAASALDDAHTAGVVHRDVKPANLLVDHKGFVYLADFGIAVVDRHRARDGKVVGSPSYMAPERFDQNEEDGPSSDIYALACVLYYALSGHPPFSTGGTPDMEQQCQAHRHAVPPPLAGQVEGITPEIDDAIRWALAKNPADRPATAGQWIAEVKRAHAVSQQRVHAERARMAAAARRQPASSTPNGTSNLLVVLLALLVVLAAALAALIMTG